MVYNRLLQRLWASHFANTFSKTGKPFGPSLLETARIIAASLAFGDCSKTGWFRVQNAPTPVAETVVAYTHLRCSQTDYHYALSSAKFQGTAALQRRYSRRHDWRLCYRMCRKFKFGIFNQCNGVY